MKKVLIIAMMFISLTMFSQKEKEVEKDKVKDLTEQLSKSYDSFEEAIAPYIKETLSFVKETGSKAIDVANVEIPIIIKQYLIFESISYGIPILLGFIILLFFNKIKYSLIVENETKPEVNYSHNYYKEIKKNKWLLRDESDFTLQGFMYYTMPFITSSVGIILILSYILPFIKVTFLPKLYLVEKFITLL